MIIINKKIGETPLQTLDRIRIEQPKHKNSTLSYAGRLDPMAEGVLLVLVDEECKEKDKYLKLNKTYEAEILWGIETDTNDILGLITDASFVVPDDKKIDSEISNLVGNHVQKYPAYSSKPVLGKPLFAWARSGNIADVEIPSKEIEIISAQKIGSYKINNKELLDRIILNISKVNGDFRQKETIDCWNKTLVKDFAFTVTKIRIVCSSGTYIRQLANMLGKKVGTGALLLYLNRVSVGEFKNCTFT